MKKKPDGRIKVAVIGAAGYWGSYYVREYSVHDDCELYAIADTAKDRRAEFASRYGVSRVFDTVEELLENHLPDICSISLPVSASAKAVIACAEAGVPVVTCEKPISETLAKADDMIECCRRRGVFLNCGTALWEYPLLAETAEWVRNGNIGDLKRVLLPGGLSPFICGNGCVPLVVLRILSGSEAIWVEGWTDPPGAAFTEEECGAFGRIGFKNGVTCDVPSMEDAVLRAGCLGVEGTEGSAWITHRGPVLLGRAGNDQYPVFPAFMECLPEQTRRTFPRAIDAFVGLYDRWRRVRDGDDGHAEAVFPDAACSAHYYRHALEIAIALKMSAKNDHMRIDLPLADRSPILRPVPYRMWGGDVTGWDAIGLKEPRIREKAI